MSVTRIGGLAAAVTIACTVGAAGTADAAGQYYGAIALSRLKNAAIAVTDLPSRVSADAAAIRDCATYDCEIVLRFSDGCGAIAQGADGKWGWAAAGTRAEAEQFAVASLGDSAPAFPDLGSATPRAATVIAATCTRNAG
ncbi:DUF4189 domain-containing protein [Nocardia huaxiensis]|uniref:DUF4189 domain-containing protein n=1 Tax=Nocardia huaxiensis TaxID=2755382 RepID=UPI001E5FB4C5|nr:DUF4189 domain-containing protein [Nocardia huaxiensis]UFS96162.1 DUF4189 domain-containing protein [Nocardia huaxiensis]